ncbi:ATP binding cassette protein [Artemisia annua]|uniref:ATP binding cassette protein n=1 Tax=Artemisia annua TaxID=35608 RepID=A0A2U1KKH1_ARTAN|nr:ATP binding cassette protein [Artemisia annua]
MKRVLPQESKKQNLQANVGKVVSYADNYYAALNAAVFTAGSFVYIPKDTKCPMKILTDFRINAKETGQFERTLIVADDRSFVEYFEGCTSPSYDKNQLHAAVVELHCNEEAEIKYSTIQNWDTGDENGKGTYPYTLLTFNRRSKISWTQVETGSAITWKHPSVVLKGDDSVGEFYSVAVTNDFQQADTGTRMIHKAKNTKSVINSKSISAGKSRTTYRGLVQVQSRADNARNSSQCDSMLIGDMSAANTYPDIQQVKGSSARIEHEASTSKIGEEELFYFQQRGIDNERARDAIVFGYCGDVLENLPDEIGAEAKALLSLRLTKSVG